MAYGGAIPILTLLILPRILRMYWHSPCHNLLAYRVPIVGIFWGTGGVYANMADGGCHPDTKKSHFSLMPNH